MSTAGPTHSPARNATWLAFVVASMLVAGCGGGGSGGGVDASSPAPAPAPTPTPPPPPAPSPAAPELTSSAIEASAENVVELSSDIDDSGDLAVLYVQNVNGRERALHAVQGTPGARGETPVFTTPVVIDAQAPYSSTNVGDFGVTVSPSGNALARWISTKPCTATTYQTVGTCRFVYTARRMAGSSWEAPVEVGDWADQQLPRAIINDAGDVALRWRGNGRSAPRSAFGLVWRAASAASYSPPTLFDDIQPPSDALIGFTLDRLGNIAFVSPSSSAGGQTILVARRGSITAGVGATRRLDTQTGNVTFEGLTGGVNGQVMALWQQADSSGQSLRWSAALDSPSQADWEVGSRGAPRPSTRMVRVMSDAGVFQSYDLDNCIVSRRSAAGTWSETALPSSTCPASGSFVAALSRSGDVVGALSNGNSSTGNTGQWLAYDGNTDTLTHAPGTAAANYLYGTPSTVGGTLLLSENGVAALVSRNVFQVLPTAAAPGGVADSVFNAWVTYLKLP